MFLGLLGGLLLILLLALGPRMLLRKSQDRLARKAMEREGGTFKLLTRAELVTGRYRRIPGVLGLTEDALAFQGLFGESAVVSTSRIQKISTGKRLASGRNLFRLEALRITRENGEEIEFVLTAASAFAWRSHLGVWAVKQRQADAEQVTPGR